MAAALSAGWTPAAPMLVEDLVRGVRGRREGESEGSEREWGWYGGGEGERVSRGGDSEGRESKWGW